MMGGGSDDLFTEMSSKWLVTMMGGGSDDLLNEMSSKWWAVVVKWPVSVFNEMSSKWWAVVVTIVLMGGGCDWNVQ